MTPLTPFRRRRILAVLLITPWLFAANLCFSAQAEGIDVDIAAGAAESALKQFSAQTGVEVLVRTELIRGKQTQAVKGVLIPIEALRAMLADTGLDVVHPENSKALTVVPRESHDPKTPRAALAIDRPEAKAAPSLERTAATGKISGRVLNVITGQYLKSARVTVKGTSFEDLTDESGTFQIAGVPIGTAIIEVFYTGLDRQQIPVQVRAGEAVEQEIRLSDTARFGDGTLRLDPYVVSAARDTDAQSIAVNEQRFAAGLKTVVATNAFGDVTDGNVGEFLKFLPGITTDTNGDEGGTVTTVSVRGFAANMTRVSSDGSQLANTGSATGNDRTFYFGQVSTNNLARVEVTKSPTPADPADTLAGSVNMVSKSAFERKAAQLQYSISLSASSKNLTLQREPFIHDQMIHKVLPGVTFDYTLPVNRNFGIVVTGQYMERYIDQTGNSFAYGTNASAGASVANPFLQSIAFLEAPRISTRQSFSVRADWRLAEHSVLTFGVQAGNFLNKRSIVDITINAGNNPAPTVAGGKALSFTADSTTGATGRGDVSMFRGADFHQLGKTTAANLRYRFNHGDWKIDAAVDYSKSAGSARYASADPGRFRAMAVSFKNPVRIEFADIGELGPASIRVFDNSDQELSLFDIGNYRLTRGTDTPRTFDDEIFSGRLDVRRQLKLFPFPVSIQGGISSRTQTRDARRHSLAWNYTGPADLSYLVHQKYRTQDDSRFTRIPWPSSARAWAAFQADPSLFTMTPAQEVSARSFSITNSEKIQETVDAFYAQLVIKPIERLTVLAGVRHEKTTVDGLGAVVDPSAVWIRNADGSFARTDTGARIRKPEAGAVGSLEELALVRKERAFRADRDYDGYYPSAHATFEIRPNLLLRASFAATYGRPNFTEIIPLTEIQEVDPTGAGVGQIEVRNPGLKPWAAKNYDLSLEYYTKSGGLFSIGAFRKEIVDFFGDTSRIATEQDLEELDLDPQYLGWEIVTRTNIGNARVDGFEFNVQQSLEPLGKWGQPFYIFVNGTKLRLEGNQRDQFDSFVPESVNWGGRLNYKRVRVTARWNYRGDQFKGLVNGIGTNGAQYIESRTLLDVNFDVSLTEHLSLFANFQNVGGVSQRTLRYGDETPAHRRIRSDTDNGTLITFGVKGTY